MSDSKILHELRTLARRMFPDNRGAVYLYGSRANGTAREDSDWDILIITDDRLSGEDDFLQFAFPYAEIGWQFGEQVTPIHYTRSQWKAQSASPFYQSVLASRIAL